nr:D-alanyl-D-alanine carboxypeptidase family protein [Nocardia stercoris]
MFRSVAAAAITAGLLGITAATGLAGAQPPTPPPPVWQTPNTDDCPNRTAPPPAIDASEVPVPGETAPSPLPVPSPPVGGPKLGGCGLVLPDGAPPPPPEISATAWLLADMDSGKVLAAKDPHGRYRPASIIKSLLAIVALSNLHMDTVVTGTQDDANADGTRVGIGPGGKYTNLQLMHALLMHSGNDAAHAIAAQLGGDEATVAKMNAKAKELGALDTRAATPSGLDGPGMSTSAYDMATIFRAAMTIPTFADIVHTEQYDFPGYPANPTVPGDQDHPGFPIANDNQLLYDYDGDLGGKTGFTDDARQTFVTAAERGGHRLILTLLKADVRPIRPPEQATRLLDYGFALPAGANIGTLPGAPAATAPGAEPQVAIPPTTVADKPAATHSTLYTILFIVGLGVLVVVIIGTWLKLSARRR